MSKISFMCVIWCISVIPYAIQSLLCNIDSLDSHERGYLLDWHLAGVHDESKIWTTKH